MSSNPRGLLKVALHLLSPDPPADSDADLLGRYVAARDGDAFAALVRRHGPMVHAVCRRRLGPGPDADDAFQVTFMVLARDAPRIGKRESLPGWLYRVAYLVALKLAGRNARRGAEPLPDHAPADAEDPSSEASARELRAALDEELNALPDRLRAVVVLCGLEERTNAEAARLLGCPTGTVDSRLSAARKRLKVRLARRGFAAGSAAALDVLLRPAPAAADVGLTVLMAHTARAAVAYAAAGGSATDPLSSLADGVSPTMGTAKLKLLAAAGMSLALFATAGLGLFHADAQEKKAKQPAAEAKADPPKKDSPPRPVEGVIEAAPARPELPNEAAVRGALAAPIRGELPERMTLKDLLDLLHERHGIVVRLDLAAFKRLGPPGGAAAAVADRADRFHVAHLAEAPADPDTDVVLSYYDAQIRLPITRGLTVGDILTEAVAQLPGRCSYRIRGNQVLIGPAYQPPTIPGSGVNAEPGSIVTQVDQRRMLEQIVGEPVSFAVEDKSLVQAVHDLRKLTGANIVIDARCKDKAKTAVSGSFSDVRLLTALTVLADMCELKPVAMNNVYYVTTPENAAKLQKEVLRDLFGEPQPPAVGGPGMPGFGGLGGGFGGIGGLGTPVPAPQPAPHPEKK